MKQVPLVVGLLATTAEAQPVSDNPLLSPGFVTLDRGDGASKVGVEASYLHLRERGATPLRFDVHGQYVDARSGVGGYLSLPITVASADGDIDTELAGVEVGGLFVRQLSPVAGIVARVGVVLPTASADPGAVFQNGVVMYSRATDLSAVSPEAILRFSASPLVRAGKVFARLDVGVDIATSPGETDDTAVVRIGPGVGYDAGTFAVMGELTTLRALGGASNNDHFIAFGAITARFPAGPTQPYLGLLIPFDDGIRDFISAMVTVGIEGRL